MSLEKKIANWLRNRLEMLPAAGRFELEHIPDMTEDPVLLLKLDAGSGESSFDRARELSESIHETAHQNSEAFDGRQRYRIKAFSRDDDEEEIGLYVFAMGIEGFGRSEPGEPTERGLLAQLMKHNQALAQINVEQSQAVNSALIAENRDLRSRVDRVESQRQEWFELIEELHSSKHEREMDMLRESAKAEQRDRALGLLAKYVPEALKQLGMRGQGAQLPAAQSNDVGEVETNPVADAQDKMRRVWRLLDRDYMAGHLDEQNQARVDSLLGIGDPIATMEEFSDKLRLLWSSLDDEVTDKIQEMIFTGDPMLAAELVSLMGDNEDAAE